MTAFAPLSNRWVPEVRMRRVRLTVRRMMVAVGLAAIAFAGFHEGYAALVIFVYAVAGLALVRAIGIANRKRAVGKLVRPDGFRRDFLVSLPVVVLILAGSSFPLVLIFPMFNAAGSGGFMTYADVRNLAIVGTILCLPAALCMRKMLW